ncbi:MAG: hypothetical protein IJT15_01500 [Rickettsiales bacterium]|nr:hypothetical protein [Rickettsiales bacterium]
MEEKTNDELNASIDSWVEEYDNKNNDITELNKSMQKKPINKGVFGGKKYILCYDNNNKHFFAKQLTDVDQTQHLLEIASSSAFISCFSHTPYPIGIKKIDSEDFIVLRFEEEIANINEQMKELLKPFINSFCTIKPYHKLLINTSDHTESWKKLTDKIRKYIIQLCVHQFFFGFFDRKYDNIIITKNGLHHIDTDLSGINDSFMFESRYYQNIYNKVKAFIIFLQNISPSDESLTNLFHTEINKIKNIDYEKFVNRYIKSCIVLGIDKKEAYNYINEHIVQKMLKIFKTTLTEYYELKDENMQDNEYFKILKQGFTEMKNIIENNDILKKITSSDGEQWFEDKFQQKEKELKNQNTTQENKDEEMERTKKHSVLNIRNQSTNNSCNNCANRCLSLCDRCSSLCDNNEFQIDG